MNKIQLNGIATHNLKNIDITIYKNAITTIYGRSGGGKSSLAYSTLYQLCADEFDAIENGYAESQEYKVLSYSGIIPAVAISQKRTNNNPRSTLYSYLNVPQILSSLVLSSEYSIPDYSYLKLNKFDNECEYCTGLGEILSVNIQNVVNKKKKIEDGAFIIWSTGSFANLYQELLYKYCDIEGIPKNIPFESLDHISQDKLLYGTSNQKLDIKFKYRKAVRKRLLKFEGAMIYAKKLLDGNSSSRVAQAVKCPVCNGARINIKRYQNIEVLGIPMQKFLTKSITSLLDELQTKKIKNSLTSLLESICQLGLGYLSFIRSVPSLSGGELQKLRFSRLLNSNISGILFVIDEISSQINNIEFKKIFSYIRKLSETNTIVLVEHAPYFIDQADYRIHIGPCAGTKGGFICSDEIIQPIKNKIKVRTSDNFIIFSNLNRNNVINQSIKIPKGRLTIFVGPSGSGKSTIAKIIEERDDAIYISQKGANFNSRSVLASTLKVNSLIADIYADVTGIDSKNFILSQLGGCQECKGIGVIKYERGFDKDLFVICPSCRGKLFDLNNELLNVKVNGLTISECYDLEISKLIEILPSNKKSLQNILQTAISLGLGHLTLNRKTQTLSGGESHRVRLCDNLSRIQKSNKILIIDEPIAGLDPETASYIAKFIYSKTELFKALIIIEHREEFLNFADYKVSIGPGSGDLGGKVLKQEFL